MKRLIAVAVLVAGLAGGLGRPAGAQDEVTLTVGLLQDMSSPNVTVGYLVPEFDVWNLQYATLTDKAADDFATIPGLAESWEGSADGLTYTYTLREGLQWSDGEPLTADDIAYTINRSRDEAWPNHASTTANLDATVIDARTVQITSSVPDPKLPTMDVYIVPKHIYETLDAAAILEYDALDGVASGPYSLTEWKSGQSWTMVKNPNWWGRDNGIDRIVFRVFTNPDAMVAALQQGEIDFAHDIPYSSVDLLRDEDGIEVVDGQQGGFTELALNGGAGGIGDGHPALQDINVRHAIYYAIDRDVLFDRVALGLGGKGTTMSPSADPSWVPDLGDELYTYDPARANQILDDAGYLDTDGDGVREMPDGSRPLEFRYAERSESSIAAPIREFVTEWLSDIGIATVVSVMDDTQLYDVQVAGNYDIFVWGWTPYVDPDPMLSYFTCDQVTSDPDNAGSNDANWCSPEYDALYQQQKVELDPARRHDIVHEMLKLFNRESTYLVLLQDADMQAYRTDRFEGWEQQPADTGPVLFTNTSPSYVNLSVIGAAAPEESAEATAEGSAVAGTTAPAGSAEATTQATPESSATATADEATAELSGGSSSATAAEEDDGGSNTGLIIGIVVAALVVVGIVVYVMRRRSSADDRE
jgi:peptide/nickel transport system substrate-binding protein